MLKNYEKENLSSSTLQQVELQSYVSLFKIVSTVEILEEESTDEEEVPTQEISLQPDSIATTTSNLKACSVYIVAYALLITDDVPFTF